MTYAEFEGKKIEDHLKWEKLYRLFLSVLIGAGSCVFLLLLYTWIQPKPTQGYYFAGGDHGRLKVCIDIDWAMDDCMAVSNFTLEQALKLVNK